MATYSLKFGSYTFPSTFYVTSVARGLNGETSKLAGAHGGVTGNVLRGGVRVTVTGRLTRTLGSATDEDELRDALATLRGNLSGKASLKTHSDRSWLNAQLVELTESHDAQFLRTGNVQLSFAVDSPYEFADTATTSATNAISSSPTTVNITGVAGTVAASPVIALTVGGSGAVTLAATLTNTTTGEACTLAGAVTGGDIITINSLEKTVKIGSTDKISLFDGVFPSLALGSNALSVAYTSGTITNLSCSYQAAYL